MFWVLFWFVFELGLWCVSMLLWVNFYVVLGDLMSSCYCILIDLLSLLYVKNAVFSGGFKRGK